MVAIQVLPLEPEDWPEAPDHDETAAPRRLPREGHWRPLPSRATRIRRRRLCALVLATGLLLGAVALVDVLISAGTSRPQVIPDAGPTPIVDDVYVVQPGDTLWTIAERLAPEQDPRPIVDELRQLTGGVELDVGDRVPVGEL
jgi:hypothetical protein